MKKQLKERRYGTLSCSKDGFLRMSPSKFHNYFNVQGYLNIKVCSVGKMRFPHVKRGSPVEVEGSR